MLVKESSPAAAVSGGEIRAGFMPSVRLSCDPAAMAAGNDGGDCKVTVLVPLVLADRLTAAEAPSFSAVMTWVGEEPLRDCSRLGGLKTSSRWAGRATAKYPISSTQKEGKNTAPAFDSLLVSEVMKANDAGRAEVGF